MPSDEVPAPPTTKSNSESQPAWPTRGVASVCAASVRRSPGTAESASPPQHAPPR